MESPTTRNSCDIDITSRHQKLLQEGVTQRFSWNALIRRKGSNPQASRGQNQGKGLIDTPRRPWKIFREKNNSNCSTESSHSVCTMGNLPCVETFEEELKPKALISPRMGEDENSLSSRQTTTGPVRFVLSLVAKLGAAIEVLLFENESTEPVIRERCVPGGILLDGCQTKEEHFQRHDSIVQAIQDLKGEEGLSAAGFEMRFVPCAKHECRESFFGLPHNEPTAPCSKPSSSFDNDPPENEDETSNSDFESPSVASPINSVSSPEQDCCEDCFTRLFCGGTMIDHQNRRRFISDGKMYDEIARLCMEHAQKIMICDGDLEWQLIDENIYALSSRSLDWTKPTLMFVTGRGKVRAGIFSRQHILTTGIEPSTAIGIVREAKRRNMNIIMLDPNCRGEREAFSVVEKSMSTLFSHLTQDCNDQGEIANHGPLCLQVHSASGAHVVLCLMRNCSSFLPHIRAIAFTDSTHNIQWTKNEQHQDLHKLLQSSSAVYFRSSKGDKADPAGVEIDKCDDEWVRRFGKIRTLWAGTLEHSLSDWCARDFIWQHFDTLLATD